MNFFKRLFGKKDCKNEKSEEAKHPVIVESEEVEIKFDRPAPKNDKPAPKKVTKK